MQKYAYFFCLFVIIVHLLIITNGANYQAMVVEHHPFQLETAEKTMLKNVNEYKTYIENARARDVDIIVFPEYGLTGIVDDPTLYGIDLSNRTFDTNKVLIELMRTTYETGLYVIVNLIEEDTTDGTTIYYNTNVVLDKKGDIVTKYRKINLLNESKLTPGETYSVFNTDFGVEFGLMTGYDILHQNPAKEIFEHPITDVILTSAWTSETPFFHSLNLQHGYAQAEGINLLAANLNHPHKGIGGSGIYKSDGNIVETRIDPVPSSQAIIGYLPINSERRNTKCGVDITPFGFHFDGPDIFGLTPTNISDFITKKNFPSSGAEFQNIDLNTNADITVSKRICKGTNFCCHFVIRIAQTNMNDVYKLMAFNDDMYIHGRILHIRTCALVVCKSNDVSTCGERINSTTQFRTIQIRAELPQEAGTIYQPTSLNFNLQPINKTKYCIDSDTNANYTMTEQNNQIIVFGILGINGASSVCGTGVVFVVLMVFFRFFL